MINLKQLIREKYGDKIQVKVNTSTYMNGDRNLNNIKNINIIDKLLKKKHFKFKGKASGKYGSYYWHYNGNNYRLTGRIDNNMIELEEINI